MRDYRDIEIKNQQGSGRDSPQGRQIKEMATLTEIDPHFNKKSQKTFTKSKQQNSRNFIQLENRNLLSAATSPELNLF